MTIDGEDSHYIHMYRVDEAGPAAYATASVHSGELRESA
jgi:hypothetical protein